MKVCSMRKKTIISLVALSVLSSMVCTGCSLSQPSAADQNVSEELIKSTLTECLNAKEYAVDEVSVDFFDPISLSEEDSKQLLEKVTKNTVCKKYLCKFEATSLERGITGSYNLIYGYVDGNWICLLSYPEEEDNWVFAAKGEVPLKKIRTDLQEIKFSGLEDSIVGSDADTQIEIKDRQSNIDLGNDSMKVSVSYDAEFAKYSFNVRMKYEFDRGSWQLVDYVVDDPEYWIVEFNENSQPAKPKDSFIVNELSDSSNYKNYMMNLKYVDNYYVAESSQSINGNELSYNYVLIVTYDEFGDIEYNVSKKYIWKNSSWQEGELEVSIKSINLNKMMGTWASTNGNFVRFTSSDQNHLKGTYTHKYADEQYVVYNIDADLDVTFEDNNWILTISQGDVLSGEEKEHIVILPFTVDFKDSVLVCNGNIYISKPDDENGPAFIINDDDTTITERDPLELEGPSEDGYDSGLHFFDDDISEETTANETESSSEDDKTAESTDKQNSSEDYSNN